MSLKISDSSNYDGSSAAHWRQSGQAEEILVQSDSTGADTIKPLFRPSKLWIQSWSSLVEGDEGCIGPSGKLLCL